VALGWTCNLSFAAIQKIEKVGYSLIYPRNLKFKKG